MATVTSSRRPLLAANRVGVRIPSSSQMWAAARLDDEGRALLHAECPHVEDCPIEAAETAALYRWQVRLAVGLMLFSWAAAVVMALVAPHARWEGDTPDASGDLNSPVLPVFFGIAAMCTVVTLVGIVSEGSRRESARDLAASGPFCDPWPAVLRSGHLRPRRRFAWVHVLMAGSERRTRLRAAVFVAVGGGVWLVSGSWLVGLCAAVWSAAVVRSRRPADGVRK